MRRPRLALLTVLMLLLAGCGVAGGGGGASPADQVTVRYGLSSAWDALMPYNSVSGSNYARIVYDKIYDRLAYVHADGSLSPRGAKSWESADGGTSIVFHLDVRARFHDGTPVTADHWAETVQLMSDPNCPTLGRANFALLTGTDDRGVALSPGSVGAEALDDATLKLKFKEMTDPTDFLNDKNRELYVLPTHLLEGIEPKDLMSLDLWSSPVGSGPCRFISELPGNQLVLASNGEYQLGAPGFDQLIMTVMDKSNLLTALIAGDLDYYAFGGNVSAEDAKVARASGLTVQEGTVPNTFYELMLNCETIPDARIRVAMELALDRALLCEQSTQGLGEVTGTSIVPGSAYGASGSPARLHSADEAAALLAEAGYDGQTYTLACTSNRSGLAALMQQNFGAAGIQVEIETVDSATLFAGMSDGTYDMGIASHTPSAVPLWFVESRFSVGNNLFHVADVTAYAARISAIRAETDAARRAGLLTELEEYFWAERPFIPLWFGRALHVQSPTVEGIDYASSSFSNENVWAWRLS